MNEQIFETVVTTQSPDGVPHVAPMGVRYQGERVVLMPFKPSTTLANILATRGAVLNLVTDTRVFAGCVTGRRYCLPMNISIAFFALKVNISKYINYIYFIRLRDSGKATAPG